MSQPSSRDRLRSLRVFVLAIRGMTVAYFAIGILGLQSSGSGGSLFALLALLPLILFGEAIELIRRELAERREELPKVPTVDTPPDAT